MRLICLSIKAWCYNDLFVCLCAEALLTRGKMISRQFYLINAFIVRAVDEGYD